MTPTNTNAGNHVHCQTQARAPPVPVTLSTQGPAQPTSSQRAALIDLRALAGEHPQAHAAGRQVLYGIDHVGEVAAETVELPACGKSVASNARCS